ncbi:MAG TPA: hypothetical protein P5275_17100 [Saprospiraceae bacterium]|nr:hypothetical protein [Saprospiraceae bacterium]MCB9271656.1 hypothetical protein [Lewinellaceae bacterium]HPG08997.1 hypothetical protein [Saprospiraceae bacterium]HPQ98881.1 hypothetical protein [Saprospiraceae bacterium]HRV86595.1 hypothetical protein [Saprospiraceae bacterium]
MKQVIRINALFTFVLLFVTVMAFGQRKVYAGGKIGGSSYPALIDTRFDYYGASPVFQLPISRKKENVLWNIEFGYQKGSMTRFHGSILHAQTGIHWYFNSEPKGFYLAPQISILKEKTTEQQILGLDLFAAVNRQVYYGGQIGTGYEFLLTQNFRMGLQGYATFYTPDFVVQPKVQYGANLTFTFKIPLEYY